MATLGWPGPTADRTWNGTGLRNQSYNGWCVMERVVFFDLVGTLISIRGRVGAQYAETAGLFGIQADPDALDRAFREVMRAQPSFVLAESGGRDVAARECDVWREIVRAVYERAGLGGETRGARFEQYFGAVFDRFATAEAWSVHPDVVPALNDLKAGGHPIGLITNFDSRVFPLLERTSLLPFFASVTIPALAGAAKPSPRIFERALATLSVSPSHAVYVGDSPVEDVAAARAAGLAAVLIDRRGRHVIDEGVPRIASLAELAALLSSLQPA
jgi:putative hydrolase of the HAD superfamily